MAEEIEKKYTVKKELLNIKKTVPKFIKQGYIERESSEIVLLSDDLISLDICTNNLHYSFSFNIKEDDIDGLKELLLSKKYIIRIRTANREAFLTLKGENKGIVRAEFEYLINQDVAETILKNHCNDFIEKVRYLHVFKGKVWEVDFFKGNNEGLILAELELLTKDESFKKPIWLDKDVSEDYRYYNNNLLNNPYNNWKDNDNL